MTDSDYERFMSKVSIQDDGCWMWTASTRRDGYGQFMLRKKPRAAHRLSFFHHTGPIPDGLFVLHHCDVKRCVAPEHLRLGTFSDNMKDAAERGLNRKHPGYTNLTPEERATIRAATGSITEIAKATGRSNATVWRVRNA